MVHQDSGRATATILIADDRESNRALLQEILAGEGFNVVGAEDGAAAWEEFKHTRLDVMMPQLAGFDVCQKIKADPEARLTPVILVTALSGNSPHTSSGGCVRRSDHGKALQAGAVSSRSALHDGAGSAQGLVGP
jgi:CheY-like chemotaxis protein